VNSATRKFEEIIEQDFDYDVTDEALESATVAGQENGSYTLGACTGLSVCPA
jgi:hypothetical protein